MDNKELYDKLYGYLVELDKECAINAVLKLLNTGIKAEDIVLGPMSKAME